LKKITDSLQWDKIKVKFNGETQKAFTDEEGEKIVAWFKGYINNQTKE